MFFFPRITFRLHTGSSCSSGMSWPAQLMHTLIAWWTLRHRAEIWVKWTVSTAVMELDTLHLTHSDGSTHKARTHDTCRNVHIMSMHRLYRLLTYVVLRHGCCKVSCWQGTGVVDVIRGKVLQARANRYHAHVRTCQHQCNGKCNSLANVVTTCAVEVASMCHTSGSSSYLMSSCRSSCM